MGDIFDEIAPSMPSVPGKSAAPLPSPGGGTGDIFDQIAPDSVASRARASLSRRASGGDLPPGYTESDMSSPGPSTGTAVAWDQTKNFGKRIGETVSGIARGTGNLAKNLLDIGTPSRPSITATPAEWKRYMEEMTAYHRQHPDLVDMVVDPTIAQYHAAHEAYKNQDLQGAVRHSIATAIPVVGPLAESTISDAEHGNLGGAAANVAMATLAPEATKSVTNKLGEIVRGVADSRAARGVTSAAKSMNVPRELSQEIVNDGTAISDPKAELPAILDQKMDAARAATPSTTDVNQMAAIPGAERPPNTSIPQRPSNIPAGAMDALAENVRNTPDPVYDGTPTPKKFEGGNLNYEDAGGNRIPDPGGRFRGIGQSVPVGDVPPPPPGVEAPFENSGPSSPSGLPPVIDQPPAVRAPTPTPELPQFRDVIPESGADITTANTATNPTGDPRIAQLEDWQSAAADATGNTKPNLERTVTTLGKGGIIGSPIAIAKLAHDLYTSPAWRTASAISKSRFADAIRTADFTAAQQVAEGISAANMIAHNTLSSDSFKSWSGDDKQKFGQAMVNGDHGTAAAIASNADQQAAGVTDPVYGAVAHLKPADVVQLYNGGDRVTAHYIAPDGTITNIDSAELQHNLRFGGDHSGSGNSNQGEMKPLPEETEWMTNGHHENEAMVASTPFSQLLPGHLANARAAVGSSPTSGVLPDFGDTQGLYGVGTGESNNPFVHGRIEFPDGTTRREPISDIDRIAKWDKEHPGDSMPNTIQTAKGVKGDFVPLHEYGHAVWERDLSSDQHAKFESLFKSKLAAAGADRSKLPKAMDRPDTEGWHAFPSLFAAYITDPSQLLNRYPDIYHFMKTEIFRGREYFGDNRLVNRPNRPGAH